MLLYLALIDNPDHHSKFEEIYYTHKDRLLITAFSILNDHYEAEDAVHNAFISIARNMNKIASFDSDRMIGYIMVITKNAAFDLLRKKKEVLPYDDSVFSTEDDEFELQFEREKFLVVVEAIRNLNEVYRPVLYLHYVEEKSAKETAHLLNRNLRTVKQQIVRGKKILLELLKEKGIDE